jgi:hypothetical protein
MASNISPLAPYTVLVFNSSVAASEQVADYYCAMRGIPLTNKIGFPMGTADYWAWRNNWYSSVITPLYDKVKEVGAKAVLTVAGCPHSVYVSDRNGGANVNIDLPMFLCAVKAFYYDGMEPVGQDEGSNGNGTYSALNPQSPLAAEYTPDLPATYLSTAYPPAVTARLAALSQGQTVGPHALRGLNPDWRGRWDEAGYLLKGVVGYWTYPDTSHPGDLEAKSKTVLDRAAANEFNLATAKTKKILIGVSWTDTVSHSLHTASVVALLGQLGFTNIVYWATNGLGISKGADLLAPAPEKFGAATTAGAQNQIANGLAPPQNPWLILGEGFWNSWVVPTVQPNPMAFLGCVDQGLTFCGASNGANWSSAIQDHGGIGGNGSPTDVAHIGSTYVEHATDVVLGMVSGLSLCEIDPVCLGPAVGGVYGDPLMRPIASTRVEYTTPAPPYTGTLPTGLTFPAVTNATPGVEVVSAEITLSGFSGDVFYTMGAGKGVTRSTINGQFATPPRRRESGAATVQLHYTPPNVAADVSTVELRVEGVLVATWSVTTAP